MKTLLAAVLVSATDLGPLFGQAEGVVPGLPGRVLGVDGAYSVAVGRGRSLWIFGDTIFGSWTPDGSRSLQAMPPNSAALVRDDDWPTGFKGARWVAAAPILASGDPKRRKWPLDVVRIGAATWHYYVEISPTGGTGMFDFEVVSTGVARLGAGWTAKAAYPLWGGKSPTYGTSVLAWKGSHYVYAGGPVTYLARIRSGRPGKGSDYSYWDGTGRWAADAGKAARLPGSGPEMSVRWNVFLKQFLMFYIPPLGRDIWLRTAPEPWGPWSVAQAVAPCQPEGDPDASCYGAKQHVELDRDRGRDVFLTYNTNVAPAKLAGRPDLYWPRLVRVRLSRQ
ncbi:MAG: DUF4185 domain-containing protein [Candidatus Sericytochromatia bacterium]|uniref:DUF4185 domain-containing protein n=1 Tax=Candidatus Tanganyikabacteria bacterium TaxID=2961651 RepID=A0A938BKJ6_9BACT|nr:DUF4185 domain-containing protein [Candidatus Tanganyikabacteria bacterium]